MSAVVSALRNCCCCCCSKPGKPMTDLMVDLEPRSKEPKASADSITPAIKDSRKLPPVRLINLCDRDIQEDPPDDKTKKRYDTKGKRGFLLILNWNFEGNMKRQGSRKDVKDLQNFFGNELGFTVCTPRSYDTNGELYLKLRARDKSARGDLTANDLRKVIQKVKEEIETNRSQYYCFICAIMTHGDREKILCKKNEWFPEDEWFSEEELKKEFNNKNFKFLGSPKIFIVQACRGKKYEEFVMVEKHLKASTDSLAYIDTKCIPVSADMMFFYATTVDNVAMRNDEKGSWIIQTCLDVFRSNYKTDHLESMLIEVRGKVSNLWAYDIEAPGRIAKEMPELVSTLTKKLWLSENNYKTKITEMNKI